MSITFRVNSITKGNKKSVVWVSAMDGDEMLCNIAVPYDENDEKMKENIIKRMEPYVKKHKSKIQMKQKIQNLCNTIDVDREVI